MWLVTSGSLYIYSGIIFHTCILPSCFPTLALYLEDGVRRCAHKLISRILLLWKYVFYVFWETFIPWTLSHFSICTIRLPCLWQLPPPSWTLVPVWEVGVHDSESDNRGHVIQWDATSCFAYHDLVPINPFLPPLLYSSFGGLLHTEQQMFFSWYYMQIFQAAAQNWYYHMRNIMTLTFPAASNSFCCFSLNPKNLQLCI